MMIRSLSKVCVICAQEKPLSEYYHQPTGGLHKRCKTCVKQAAITRHYTMMRNPEWLERERGRGREKQKRRIAAGFKPHRPKDQTKAHNMVGRAITKGILRKPANCEGCRKETPSKLLHAHHYAGYECPMEVTFLCTACHRKEHRTEAGQQIAALIEA